MKRVQLDLDLAPEVPSAWAHLMGSAVKENPCATCYGTGWKGFFPGGGVWCDVCGGLGKARHQEQKNKRVSLED